LIGVVIGKFSRVFSRFVSEQVRQKEVISLAGESDWAFPARCLTIHCRPKLLTVLPSRYCQPIASARMVRGRVQGTTVRRKKGLEWNERKRKTSSWVLSQTGGHKLGLRQRLRARWLRRSEDADPDSKRL
jgi:hypothetical protein